VDKLSRPQVVKKLWEYIHGHALQNPSNKREIICDDAMRAVFATDKIDMFRMNKVLGRYVYSGYFKFKAHRLNYIILRHLHAE
jgi:chromatin remodeling complex protein RSC6